MGTCLFKGCDIEIIITFYKFCLKMWRKTEDEAIYLVANDTYCYGTIPRLFLFHNEPA